MLFPDFSFLGEGLRTRCKSTKQMKLLVENPGFILFAVKKKLILQVINRLFMKADINVPIPVLRRMPSYLSFVKTLQKQGEKYVSSTRIAEYMEIDSTQVTKDLSHTGISGKTRVGYEVDSFVRILEDFLGFSRVDGAFLVGAGSLGSALLQDKGLSAFGLQIEAAFDTDKTKIGTKVNDIEIFHIDQFRAMAAERKVVIGIITVPAEHAQNVADLMVAWGIKAIWNFTPARIKVPTHIVVQYTTIYMNLAILFNKLYNDKGEKK